MTRVLQKQSFQDYVNSYLKKTSLQKKQLAPNFHCFTNSQTLFNTFHGPNTLFRAGLADWNIVLSLPSGDSSLAYRNVNKGRELEKIMVEMVSFRN